MGSVLCELNNSSEGFLTRLGVTEDNTRISVFDVFNTSTNSRNRDTDNPPLSQYAAFVQYFYIKSYWAFHNTMKNKIESNIRVNAKTLKKKKNEKKNENGLLPLLHPTHKIDHHNSTLSNTILHQSVRFPLLVNTPRLTDSSNSTGVFVTNW